MHERAVLPSWYTRAARETFLIRNVSDNRFSRNSTICMMPAQHQCAWCVLVVRKRVGGVLCGVGAPSRRCGRPSCEEGEAAAVLRIGATAPPVGRQRPDEALQWATIHRYDGALLFEFGSHLHEWTSHTVSAGWRPPLPSCCQVFPADRCGLVLQLATEHRLRGVASPCSKLHAPPTSRF